MKYTWSDIVTKLRSYAEGFLLLLKYHRQDQVPPETTPVENIAARIEGNITGQVAVGSGIAQLRIPTLLSTIFKMRHRSPIYEAEPAEVFDATAEIKGDVGGQVAVGRNIFQLSIAPIIGCLVQILPRPRIFPRPTPIDMRPRAFPDLVNRQTEVNIATNALTTRQLVEFYGQHGIGKSALLRFLAHQPFATSFNDGVIDLPTEWVSKEDLLQFIFDIFYDSKPPYMPSKGEIQVQVRDKQALLLLDNENLTQGEVKELINVVPNSAFLIASAKRRFIGEGRSMALSGLPPEDALTLLESNLTRSLSQPERSGAQQLCDTLKRHPLYILGVATIIDTGRSPTELVALPVETLMVQIIKALPETDRHVIGTLAVVEGAPLVTERVVGLTGLTNAETILERLVQRGLVQSQASYHVSDIVAQAIAQVQDLNPLRVTALAYFIDWAEGNQQNFDLILESADAILAIMAWAIETGRWADVLRLARAVEGALAFGKRWTTWEQVLQWGRQAAEVLGDQAALAWSWHQLGSRALCLNEISSAFFFLYQALRLREDLGDVVGAAVTRHNLYLLLSPPPPQVGGPPPSSGPTLGSFFTWPLILLPIIIAAIIAILLFLPSILNALFSLLPPPPPTPRAIVFVTITPPTIPGPTETGPETSPLTPSAILTASPTVTLPVTLTAPSTITPPVTLTASPTVPPPPPTITPTPTLTPTPLPPTPIPLPIIFISPTQLDFGTQLVGTTSPPQRIMVGNQGRGTLTISNNQLIGQNPNDFNLLSPCVRDFTPDQSCFIMVSFTPTEAGERSAFLSIFHNGTTGVEYVTLTGVGVEPPLQIDKDDGGISITPGGTITYTITYANPRSENATGVVLTETVPANTNFVSNNSAFDWNCPDRAPAGTMCTLNVGTLPVNGTGFATFRVTVTNPVPATVTPISNTASIGDNRTPNAASDTDNTPLILQGPILEIDKNDGGIREFRPGELITYTLTYTNTGDQDASGVVITETIPPSTTFNSSANTEGWLVADGTASCAGQPAGTRCILPLGTVGGAGGGGSVKFVVTITE